MALDDFRERLCARLGECVARRHAVAHVQVPDHVDREPDGALVVEAGEGQGADAAFDVARVVVDEHFGRDVAVRVVERVQLRRQQFFRPVVILVGQEPALLRVVREALRGVLAPEKVVRPEIVACQTLEELAQGAGVRGELRTALAVGEQQRAVAVADVNGPDAIDRVEPRALDNVKADLGEPPLHAVDRRFERGVLACDVMFNGHLGARGKVWL